MIVRTVTEHDSKNSDNTNSSSNSNHSDNSDNKRDLKCRSGTFFMSPDFAKS